MTALGFKADRKITDVLRQGFTLSAEVIPPRNGTEQASVLEQIKSLISCGAQFLAVTKGAGGSLRGGSLPIVQAIKETFGVPCIAHFTCRDLTPEDVENQLMDHHYFGVRNILALRGDPPSDQPDWKPSPGSYEYAHQLLKQIVGLNGGEYRPRSGNIQAKGPVEKTDFCLGAAVYPEHPNEKERLDFFRQKIEAGAEYGITQMVFDADVYGRFVELCTKNGIQVPILPGTRLLKTKSQAERMSSRFGVSVPQKLIDQLPETSTPENLPQAVDLFMEFVEKLRSYQAPGLHLFVLSDTQGSCEVLKRLR